MLIYVDEVIEEIRSIQDYAAIVRDKFVAERPANELLLDARALNSRIKNLAAMMPEEAMVSGALRHSSWLLHWLERDNVERCTGDVHEIVDYDLPEAISAIQTWSRRLAYIDADLREEISPLIRMRQF